LVRIQISWNSAAHRKAWRSTQWRDPCELNASAIKVQIGNENCQIVQCERFVKFSLTTMHMKSCDHFFHTPLLHIHFHQVARVQGSLTMKKPNILIVQGAEPTTVFLSKSPFLLIPTASAAPKNHRYTARDGTYIVPSPAGYTCGFVYIHSYRFMCPQ
jgi:hypothetical protein